MAFCCISRKILLSADTGESVAESPYPLRIVAGQSTARKSTIHLSQPGSAVINHTVEFEVQARDSYGNRCHSHLITSLLATDLDLLFSDETGIIKSLLAVQFQVARFSVMLRRTWPALLHQIIQPQDRACSKKFGSHSVAALDSPLLPRIQPK